jgi:hypothetical protein
MSDNNVVIFGYEIQHKLASETWSPPRPKQLRPSLIP